MKILIKITENIIFSLFVFGYFPIFLVKLKQADDKKRLLADRFGFLPDKLLSYISGSDVIWIHAVSVGEVKAAENFIKCIRNEFGGYKIVISTVTPTGNTVAKKLFGNDSVFYLPLDISFITDKVMSRIKPSILVLMETEIWPNLIFSAKKFGAKVIVANGRLSPKGFRGYFKIKKLIKPVIDEVSLFLLQTEQYKKRLLKIGVDNSRVVVAGNMKFDSISELDIDEESAAERINLPWRAARIFVAASTHPGEEELVIKAYLELRKKYPLLKLIIAPRHIERKDDIITVAEVYGLHAVARTDNFISENCDVFILNTIGELQYAYKTAELVFMGGSLIPHGGQNPLEAVILKKAVMTGKYTFNFKEIYKALFSMGVAFKVESVDELCSVSSGILSGDINTDVDKGYKWIIEMKGASERSVKYVKDLLEK